ncbi:hypothetical protein WICMUC_005132 [Wickerhamomyces mucosus]|uniref:Association with the SNF1 complex (ASC) domain-containing protein n=1 Tax=Wickerhamomyces mucosus TaxID=1378264 RepID=A0A9P8PAX8_9ASCO|nr:hypothetical protein WICMUC_005132 [Wickerhamomyces mucosus]
MGVVTSQEESDINNSEFNSNITNEINNLDIVHPLLSPQNLKTTASTIMTDHNLKSNESLQDVTMSGTSSANLIKDQEKEQIQGNEQRRRSTIILTEDHELEKPKHLSQEDHDHHHHQEISDQQYQHQDHHQQQPQSEGKVPIEICWFQGGENVFITGSFTGWRKMIKLNKDSKEDGKFSIKLKLPIGTHRFRFIVDNELRFSDYLPTATDQMGNFVNYIEINQSNNNNSGNVDENHFIDISEGNESIVDNNNNTNNDNENEDNNNTNDDDDDMGNGYSRFHENENNDVDGSSNLNLKQNLKYVRDIPKIFIDPTVMEQYYLSIDNNQQQQSSWLIPPQLPPHLENVILNNFQTNDKNNNSGALPIPNYVVLNHLATTSIKHNTLAVASVVRYKRKYVTQVLYAPLQ